ncbi:CDP-glucose 4,6-dehydratase [Caenispirillum salinarum]|nr:CDP-glucose 4,6-dehydratase [Caenispirillum salinarum]
MTFDILRDAFSGRRILVTGHTGFKGAWLCEMLLALGARPHGLALPPPTDPALHDVLDLGRRMTATIGDIRDPAVVAEAFETARPEVVFHLAAQPIVRASYDDPAGTYAANVMGTLYVMEAMRRHGTPAGVMITTDKVYRNPETGAAFREGDELGGKDPYSASKACAELVIRSHREAFFAQMDAAGSAGPLVASVRAGNIIGGGDWAADRIVPDFARAVLGRGEAIRVRSPHAVRPWQQVMEPLTGYMMAGARLLAGDREVADAFNFGPDDADAVPVADLLERCRRRAGRGEIDIAPSSGKPEAGLLRLDSARARSVLGWAPRFDLDAAVAGTIDWYAAFYDGGDAATITRDQIAAYMAAWTAVPERVTAAGGQG